MQRRTFLKSVVAAYCTPIVASLAPMLMRPVEVVSEPIVGLVCKCWTENKDTGKRKNIRTVTFETCPVSQWNTK